MRSKKFKKTFNIILSVILVLGVLSTSFGAYAVVFANNKEKTTAENPDNLAPDPGKFPADENFDLPEFDDSPNEISLNEEVKVFTGKSAKKITDSIISVEEDSYHTYNEGGRLKLTFNGKREILFGDLDYGDFFFIDGVIGSALSGTYAMKVNSIHESEDQTTMEVVQPELDEVFDSMNVAFNEVLSEDNLVSYQTIDGVSAHFGDVEKEISNISHKEDFDTASSVKPLSTAGNIQAAPLATDYSTNPSDLIIELDIDLNKKEEEEKDDDQKTEVDADLDFKLKGKFGIEDLSAYMVCDMPKPLQFNELMFGVRGKEVFDAKFEAGLDANFNPKATDFKYDGKFIQAEMTGLNEKWIPLGIWQFTGATMISITKKGFETANLAPSIFVMLYMDAEGNFELKFNAGFTHESTFNSGLSVYKNGKINCNVVNYPYAVENGKIIEPNKVSDKWYVDLTFDADASVTIFGSSVQFYFAGINFGEISLFELGFEGDGQAFVSADNKDGIKTSNSDNKTSLFLRGFLKAIGFKAKVSAEVEAFQRELNLGADAAFQLVDITLFEFGKNPEKRKVPVSTKWIPSEFESVVCIVGDVSGSMGDSLSSGGTKIEALREAGHVITNIVENSANVYQGAQGLSIVKFESNAQTVSVPHNDYEFIHQCIDTLNSSGGTNISSGLEAGISQLMGTKSNQKVIILMTDGQDSGNRENMLQQARTAAENGIKIYTIGFGNSVNEELLKAIATEGKGEYRYSATDSIVSIISGFLYSYESSRGDVLLDVQSTVSEGETVTAKDFDVPEKSGNLNTVLYWPGSLLELILIDPNGRKVDEKYPGATINNETIPATVTISEPLHGNWKFKVKGIETSYENEPYYAIASFNDKANTLAAINTPLPTMVLVGSYCLPIGVFMIFVSISLLILVNKKKKGKNNINC